MIDPWLTTPAHRLPLDLDPDLLHLLHLLKLLKLFCAVLGTIV